VTPIYLVVILDNAVKMMPLKNINKGIFTNLKEIEKNNPL
jgi:hypothetical protein